MFVPVEERVSQLPSHSRERIIPDRVADQIRHRRRPSRRQGDGGAPEPGGHDHAHTRMSCGLRRRWPGGGHRKPTVDVVPDLCGGLEVHVWDREA